MKHILRLAVLGFAMVVASGAAAYDPMPDPRMPSAIDDDAGSKQRASDSPFGPAARARARSAPKFGETDRTRKRNTTYRGNYSRNQR